MSTSTAPLRVGLIGIGTAGRFFHAPLLSTATAASLSPRFRVLGSQGAYVTYGLDGQEDELRAGRPIRGLLRGY